MAADPSSLPLVILIAPNVSVRMGGEAIKSLQIYQALAERGVRVHQITHSRVREEVMRLTPPMDVTFIEDDATDRFCWRSKFFRAVIGLRFMWRAARVAQGLVDRNPGAIVHYTAPISPVQTYFTIRRARVIIGPINGNVHHPPAFRAREDRGETLRRVLLRPIQAVMGAIYPAKRRADALIVAGGQRTRDSLRYAGCRPGRMHDSLDSGIPDHLRDEPIVEHRGVNLRFVQSGRLVAYKGADLAIRAVGRATQPVELDIIGGGPMRGTLEEIIAALGLHGRVRLHDWKTQPEMYRAFRESRGFVFPSLAEANGIVVQEAMMIGLPVLCAAWGGPGLLVTPETGIPIDPTGEEALIAGLANAMDRLSVDPDLANRYARAARQAAIDRGVCWSDLIDEWLDLYRALTAPGPTPVPAGGAS